MQPETATRQHNAGWIMFILQQSETGNNKNAPENLHVCRRHTFKTVNISFSSEPSPRPPSICLFVYFPPFLAGVFLPLRLAGYLPGPWAGLSWALSRAVTPLFHRSIILFARLWIWVFICPSICLLPLAWQVEMTRRDRPERQGEDPRGSRGEG